MKKFSHFLNAKTRSPEQIAAKHGVSVEQINKSLKDGMKIEREHTKIPSAQREIALDHLWERPDYYNQLKKIEK